ncbi:hypothetical protein R3X26_00380 [Vibrio sp. TH_r3]|uniref:TPR domain-containing protein n=1 Tax=Vibrio sp. TH_r3 TaxID=3082084 RepID=UPI0029556FA9|nr:hypothetical protein [Vibrio sp. TH_r3]MDV7102857.1 hypothetical protein [Vibrio sp. TH_r3]
MSFFILCVILTLVVFIGHFKWQKSTSVTTPIIVSICLSASSLFVWSFIVSPEHRVSKMTKLEQPMTIDEIIVEIQDKLTQDRNNQDLWFQLGQGYFANGEFANANTCFDYVIRLTESPSSTVYAAKATALYYLSSQRMTKQVQYLLDQALTKDQLNDTALMLIANDHFISFRYDKAIEIWQKVLDSERQGIDRVAIINSINKTRELSHK